MTCPAVNASVLLNHSEVLNPDASDDHAQYLRLVGRAGGQTAIGGTGASEELALRGSSNANLGLIRAQSPIDFDDVTPANALSPYSVRDASTASFSAGFIGGTFADLRTITFSNALFIYEVLRGTPAITSAVAPAFAAFTLFNAIPRLIAGSVAGQNPLSALVLNAGPTFVQNSALTHTTNCVVVSAVPKLEANAAGTMNLTNITGLSNSPVYDGSAGATLNFGTIRGLWAQTPAVALFGSGAGSQVMAAYHAVDVESIAFGGNVPKTALRSQIPAATNARFLNNLGGAESNFGAGSARWNDNAGILLGNADDVLLNWNASAFEVDPLSGDDFRIDFATAGAHIFRSSNGDPELRLVYNRMNLGAASSVGNQTRVYTSPSRTTQVNGEWADDLHTAAGNLTIAHTMGGVFGLVYNAQSLTIGAGSITGPIATLNIGGMTTSNLSSATSTSAIRSTGRMQQRGMKQYPPINPANLSGSVTAWSGLLTGSQNNSARYWARITCDAATTLRGIDSTAALDGDTYEITNVGANALTITNQDAAAAAADRIILGAHGGTLGVDETIAVRYDGATARWRVVGV